MLKLKKRFHLPTICLTTPVVALSPVMSEDDELVQAIEGDVERRDDNWQLTTGPDTAELETFWRNVEDDIAHDPTWQSFDD